MAWLYITSVSPSWYCGATSWMRHSGSTPPASSAAIPSSTMPREGADSGRSRNTFMVRRMARMLDSCCRLGLHRQVALHLLMERGAEVGAVERIDAWLAGLELHSL